MTKTELSTRLHDLPAEAATIAPPQRFTYPFCYEAHPLCQQAAAEVVAEVERHEDWHKETAAGKMMGVLIVEGGRYLAAFSGTLCGRGTLPYFVPPVFDLHAPGCYFQEEEARISAINAEVRQLEEANEAVSRINDLKHERKQRSIALQRWLFEQFRFLNARGEEASLMDIFADRTPPSGSGECCAPKLLQAAYTLGLRPLCMAEFWMGRSPRDEVREEGHYYPSCRSRCLPILGHMLKGLDVDPNPLLEHNRRMAARLKTIYEDDAIVVVDKPSGMLSVPGKDDLPSVQSVMRERYPEATGPMIVHRLDMDTSGLMVVAKTEEAYHVLQEEFVRHQVSKQYTALLEREMPTADGIIDLLICPNPYDRPRQIVNAEYGKRSITRYHIEGRRATFWPQTGRTHQLRLHAAHPDGLGNPIVGDRLYGTPSTRLCLHAERLTIIHPTTHEEMTFASKADF